MTDRRLVLASASPARLRLLRDAGIEPEVVVSGVDEDEELLDDPVELVTALAAAKADAVAERLGTGDAIVLGCDSMLVFDGVTMGKPGTPAAATERWRRMRNHNGILMTGHCVVDTSNGARAAGVGSTTVRFGDPSEAEIAAYVASGEPLQVAGAFTLDGRAAPFIEGIDGDASNVIGLSLPLLRRLLAEIGIGITELWS